MSLDKRGEQPPQEGPMLNAEKSMNRRERGQSVMELAISLLFLLTLLAAVIDLGWAFYTMTALRDTAEEAAAYAAMCPEPANRPRVITRLEESATAPISMADLDNGDIEICVLDGTAAPDTYPDLYTCASYPAPPATRGNQVRVSLRIQHQILTPFVGSFIGTQTYPLSVTVFNTILVDECATENN
jgi:Flp pilus assembly protein TadG